MKAAALVACATWLLASGVCRSATAEEARRRIVVLESRMPADAAWPEGSRAVVAELSARDDELVLRAASDEPPGALSEALARAADEPGTFGAVAVVRAKGRALAFVHLHGQKSAIRVEDDLSEGVIAEGAIALRVSELLHVRRFELPPSAPPAPKASHRAPPGVSVEPWVGIGAFGSSSAESPAPALALGARVPVLGAFGLEGSGVLSLASFRVETAAGDAEVSAQQLSVHAFLDPFADAPFALAFGLGGGLSWLSATARATGGYIGKDASTLAGLVSARLAGSLKSRRLRLFALCEASLLLPSVSVSADEDELATLGRPWLFAALGVGFSP